MCFCHYAFRFITFITLKGTGLVQKVLQLLVYKGV